MIYDISKHLRNKKDYLAYFEYFNDLMQWGLIEEKKILISLLLILVKGINTDYLIVEEVKLKIIESISKPKNLFKLSYELAINDIIEDLKSQTDSPKKLNVKHKNDPNNEMFDGFIIKNINDNKDYIQVLESFLENLKN